MRIALRPYDTSRTLVIDPILTYSSYVGGSRHDDVTAIKADDAGSIYVNAPWIGASIEEPWG